MGNDVRAARLPPPCPHRLTDEQLNDVSAMA
jgi:hypothetical protein